MAFSPYGTDLFGNPSGPSGPVGVVAQRFVFPPFSVLDARQGEWQDRKRAWIASGIKSEIGRSAPVYSNQSWYEEKKGSKVTDGDGTSIFDPVVCELVYKWFSAAGGAILDPFAGGSVRGIVAAALGRQYTGIELRGEQVEANRAQAGAMGVSPAPLWICGDSAVALAPGGTCAGAYDLVFSCPTYGDLEVYSDDPADLSAMEWGAFVGAYRAIIALAVARLREDRFACFVVGDFRDTRGIMRNFVGETVEAFTRAGAALYNEAILVTSVGTAAMRVTKQFTASRKLAKTHQNLLVFVKGDPRRAAAAAGIVEGGT